MRRSRIKISCLSCSKEIELTPSSIRAGRKCCSHACSKKYVWSKPEYREHMSLVHKGNSPTNLEQIIGNSKLTHGNRDKQLGQTPWNKDKTMPQISGEKHYLWISDRSLLKDDHKDRGGQLHREWSLSVKNRDGWQCKIANGDCSGRLESHHILGWKSHPELRYEINNGITLCHYHHPRKRIEELELSPLFQSLVLKAK